ncbi:GNAT family N-acetyltransferase [Demequina sp.]|uniref:GNAT family N-acetyltransferase n=1 Tax=Demequina sp. TaxID=2050685 RepID=UPI003D096DD3
MVEPDVPQRTWRVPARIETARLVLRPYTLEDVAAMDDVIPANREHLLTFLPWAVDEPVGTEKRTELVEKFIADFKAGTAFTLGIFDRATGEFIGGTGLHLRDHPGHLEIGYWLAEHRQGEGLMTEAAAALTRVALQWSHSPFVEIRCSPANARSRLVPQRLGFALVDTLETTCGSDAREELTELWQLTPEAFLDSPASAEARPALVDGIGSPLAWPV